MNAGMIPPFFRVKHGNPKYVQGIYAIQAENALFLV